MATLHEDIYQGSDWTVRAFAELGRKLDYSLESLKDIDLFFDGQTENGKVKAGSLLENNFGYKIFAIASYVGEALIKNCTGSIWVTDDNDPHGEVNISVKLANGSMVWPGQKVFKRFKNGSEDNLYLYANLVLGRGHRIYSKSDWINNFGYKMAWVAIKSATPLEVVEKLYLPETKSLDWNEAMSRVYDNDDPIVITPQINEWCFVVGRYLYSFGNYANLDKLKKDVADLSSIFGEVQAFATHRVSEYHHWVLAKSGKIERCFSYSGESGKVLHDEGQYTLAEKNFQWNKLKSFEWFPNEEDVLNVAEKWSVNPTKIKSSDIKDAICYITNIPK